MKTPREEKLEALLREILEHGDCYISAIELDYNLDSREWEKRVREALDDEQDS